MSSSHLEPPKDELVGTQSSRTQDRSVSPILPEIPAPELDLDLSSIIGPSNPEIEKVQKRASNVMKLAQENEKLKAELKAMSERLEAAERKREALAKKGEQV